MYGKGPLAAGRDTGYEFPDYALIAKEMFSRQNMTLTVLRNRYAKMCRDNGLKFCSYRQFCENCTKWCGENRKTLHFGAVIGQKMEVDFAGKTFRMVDRRFYREEERGELIPLPTLPYEYMEEKGADVNFCVSELRQSQESRCRKTAGSGG